MGTVGKIRLEPGDSRGGEAKSGKLDSRSSWLTVSKALEMSRKATLINVLLSRALYHLSHQ